MKAIDEKGNLHDLSKGKVIIFCYPKDSTPGCTIEAKEFSSLQQNFLEKGYFVYGLSKGDEKSKEKFITNCGLTIPLLIDKDAKILTFLGAAKEKSMFGKKYLGVERITFLLEKGKVTKEWKNVNPIGHAKQVLQELSL